MKKLIVCSVIALVALAGKIAVDQDWTPKTAGIIHSGRVPAEMDLRPYYRCNNSWAVAPGYQEYGGYCWLQ